MGRGFSGIQTHELVAEVVEPPRAVHEPGLSKKSVVVVGGDIITDDEPVHVDAYREGRALAEGGRMYEVALLPVKHPALRA